MKKVLVIGAGNVGAHIINYGVSKNVGAEFYLLDLNQELEKAQIMDLQDTLLFSKRSKVEGINFDDPSIQDMDVVIVTAGAAQESGESRCKLLQKNRNILGKIARSLGSLKPTAIVLLVTNPVDILTHVAYELFDLPKSQIFGTGTILDSARLRWRISEHNKINVKNVHGYVLGEHGDSEFVAWSTVKPGGNSLSDPEKEALEKSVQQAAYEIIDGKGSTYFGISAATISLLGAILHDSREIYPVSTIYPHSGHQSLSRTPIGVPAVIGAAGIDHVPRMNLTTEELKKLEKSADKLYALYDSCPLNS